MIPIKTYKQKKSNLPQRKIGLISFTDPRREVKLAYKREKYIKDTHQKIVKEIRKAGFIAIDPQKELKGDEIIDQKWGISELSELDYVEKQFQKENIAGLIIGCFSWNEPDLPHLLAKKLSVPIALLTINNPQWPGVTALTSTGASFWQLSSV